MRLICPKCAAQYEVDASAIPDQGREVQCSACGNIWFTPGTGEDIAPLSLGTPQGQHTGVVPGLNDEDRLAQAISRIVSETPPPQSHMPEIPADEFPAHESPAPESLTPDTAQDAASDPVGARTQSLDDAIGASDAAPPHDNAAFEATAEVSPTDAEAPRPATEAEAEHISQDGDAQEQDGGAFVPMPPRPQLDENVLSILREEAERETEARVAEGTLTPQPESDTIKVAPAPFAPTSDLRAEPPLTRAHPVAAPDLPDFSDLNSDAPGVEAAKTDAAPEGLQPQTPLSEAPLPDAAVIAATLRPAHARGDSVAALNRGGQKSGFRTGFLTVIVLALIAAAIYVFAPQISAAVPPLGHALDGYREAVDMLRTGLNEKLTTAIALAAKALGA